MTLETAGIFVPGNKVIMSIQDSSFPLRFHPRVHEIADERLALDMPPEWWKLADLKPGIKVLVSTVSHECILSLEAEIQEVHPHHWPSLVLRVAGAPERIQRRTFYRLEYMAGFELSRVVPPDGRPLGPLAATLLDLSAGGIGFKTHLLLPSDSLVETQDLFAGLAEVRRPESFLLEVRWCRAHHSDGYRVGAAFQFESPREHERMARFVHQMQVVRLSKYARIQSARV